MKITRVCVIGGTGFVGRHIVGHLARAGIPARVLARHPQRHRDLGVPPGNEVRSIDGFGTDSLTEAMAGCDAAINLVGILNESRRATFRQIHVELVENIVEACKRARLVRLLHMSALHASEANGGSAYLRSKGEGENRAHTLGQPDVLVTSFRPSVIFGADDSFINRFRQLMRIPGPLPLACPDSRFAPVYVGDVAEAFVRALTDPSTVGRAYDLCGPRVFTLRQIVEYIAWHSGMYKGIVSLSDKASRLQAEILGRLPGTPFTLDNYRSLQVASVCEKNGLAELGIAPTDMDVVVPRFLART
jgi:NADH dehydrogenase